MPNEEVRTIWDIEREIGKAYQKLGDLLYEFQRLMPKEPKRK